MVKKFLKALILKYFLVALVPVAVAAEPVELHAIQFPERTPVNLWFLASPEAPNARVTAEVFYKQGQARIEMLYDDMKPAILFGGDVTCYVVWAVSRDGQFENLGELLTRKKSGKASFSTGKKSFALMVTAESYYLVGQPSDLLIFHNRPISTSEAPCEAFQYANFKPAPRHSMDAIGHIIWDSKVPLDLLQARKAFELATRNEAETHAPEIYADAKVALDEANDEATRSTRSRELFDYARRAVTLSNESLNIANHRIEAKKLEEDLARRRAETEALERRAAEAEALSQEAQRVAEQVRLEGERIRAENERMVSETDALRSEKGTLEAAMLSLREEKIALEGTSEQLRREKSDLEVGSQILMQEKAALEAEAQRLKQEKAALEKEASRLAAEKAELAGRLQGALSHVAETTESGRGFVINLPDILFDFNESTLKPEAQMVLAKLSGILLMLPDQTVMVEGHTDATGEAAYNAQLSQNRANAVSKYLQRQGVSGTRLHAIGYGMERPVADNSTEAGRKKNRRVEIVIGDAEMYTVEVTEVRTP